MFRGAHGEAPLRKGTAARRSGTSLVASVALVAGLTVGTLGVAGHAAADTVSYATQPAGGPPDLINLSELDNGVDELGGSNGLGQASEGTPSAADTTYAATTDQIASLEDFEAQAVDDLITDHQLATGDYDLVESWARDDADAELWALIDQALTTPAGQGLESLSATDVANVQTWMGAVYQRSQMLDASDAAYEYARFAGADVSQFEDDVDVYTSPDQVSAGNRTVTAGTLQSDLGVYPGVTNPVLNPYTDGDGPSTPATASNGEGYCAYTAPNPLQSQWTYDIYDSSNTAAPTCYEPCTSTVICNVPTPTLSNFMDWGQADVTESLDDSSGFASTAADVSRGAEIGLAATDGAGVLLGSGVAASGAIPAVAASLSGSAFQTAVFPFADEPYFEPTIQAIGEAVEAGEGAEEGAQAVVDGAEIAGGAVASTGIGVIVGAVIFAIATAIQEGITLLTSDDLPQQLVADIVAAHTGPAPDLATVASGAGEAGLFSLFLGSLTPVPTFSSCDNPQLADTYGTVGFTGYVPDTPTAPCGNQAAIPPPSSADPQFLVTPAGGSTTQQEYATWQDTTTDITNDAYLHGNWIVPTTTATASLPSATVMSDRFTYTDWDGDEYTGWLDTDGPTPGFLSVLTADLGAGFTPTTCLQTATTPATPTQCTLSPTIETVSASGGDETLGLTQAPRDTSGTLGPPPIPPAGFTCVQGETGCPTFPTTPPPGDVTAPLTLTASPSPAIAGQAVTLTAELGANLNVNGTGTMTFTDDAGTLCANVTVTFDGSPDFPEATCQATIAPAQTAHVVVVYSGSPTIPNSGGFEGGVAGLSPAAADLTLPVLDETQLQLESPGRVTVGSLAPLVAHLTAGGDSPAPTGTVTFSDGTTTLCTVPLSPTGSAECEYTPRTAGTETILATYSGDPQTEPATATGRTLTVQPLEVRFTLAASPASGTVGAADVLTATLTPQTAASTLPRPSGTVSFSEPGPAGPVPVCSGVELAAATPTTSTASCTVTPQRSGDLFVSADYTGDATTAAAASEQYELGVDPGATSTTVTPSSATPGEGQTVTYTATVANLAPDVSGPAPAGLVKFLAGNGAQVCEGTLPPTAPYVATCAQSYAAQGPQTVTVEYLSSNRESDADSTGSTTVVVGDATSTTALTASDPGPVVGEEVTYTATVAGLAGGAAPTGSVSFATATATLCAAVPLPAAAPTTATCTAAAPAAGSEVVTASYSGDGNDTTSSGMLPLTISPAPTAVTLATTSATPRFGRAVVVTAGVAPLAPSTAGPAPTGTVELTVDGLPAGTGLTLPGSGTVRSAPLTSLVPGANTVTATYSGDGNYTGATDGIGEQVRCTQTITTTVTGPITVDKATCVEGGTVDGAVTVAKGGALALLRGTVEGAVGASHPAEVLVCGSTTTGQVSIASPRTPVLLGGPGGSGCAPDQLGGLSVTGAPAGLTVDGATITGALSAVGDRGGVTAVDDTVTGATTTQDDSGGVTLSSDTLGSVTATSDRGGLDVDTSMLTGSLLATFDSGGVTAYEDTVGGSLAVTYATGGTSVYVDQIAGSLTVSYDTGTAGVVIFADTVTGGGLSCNSDSPAPVDFSSPNTVAGVASGQCASLAT